MSEISIKNNANQKINLHREVRAAGNSSGSTLTKIARSATLESFVSILKNDLNLHIVSFEKLKTQHIQKYVDHLKSQNLSTRTIQNNLSHIRTALSCVGRNHFANSEQNSNKALGASGASRDGMHKAISYDVYIESIKKAFEINEGASAAMRLQKELGLRAREAVQSVSSLKSWEKSLKFNGTIHILHGTKGGRSRLTTALNAEKALEAVRIAISISNKQNGKLIESSTLQGAVRMYGRVFQKIGLVGESASHSLRCAYAVEKYAHYVEKMENKGEALAALSLDLGHGDGRGRYVSQVYLKN